MGLRRIPADSVVRMASDSICDRAAQLIARHDGGNAASTGGIVVARVGEVYWVDDPQRRAGEWARVYLTDRELTRVIAVH